MDIALGFAAVPAVGPGLAGIVLLRRDHAKVELAVSTVPGGHATSRNRRSVDR